MSYLIGNWKMQLNETESEALAAEMVRLWGAEGAGKPGVTMVLCPSHMALEEVAKLPVEGEQLEAHLRAAAAIAMADIVGRRKAD